MTPGRNEPCPCGSGKKYKKCCSDIEDTVRIDAAKVRREEARSPGYIARAVAWLDAEIENRKNQ